MKYFGSLTLDRKSSGCRSRAECRADVPAFGTPITKKSGSPTSMSLATKEQHVHQFHRIA